MNIPETLRSGDTAEWKETFSDYPPSDGWTLAFDLRSKDKTPITLIASVSGSEYAISILPSVSGVWQPAVYKWAAYVYKGTPPNFTAKNTVGFGTVEIWPNLTADTAEADRRTYWEKIRDEMKEAYLAISNRGYTSYTIGEMTWVKENLGQLRDALNDAEGHILRERAVEKISKGEAGGLTILSQFKRL